jgi:hypothetical protein
MAVGIAGYLCPINRFPNVDKLTSYVGLCPTTHQSADTLYHGKLKPDVNRRLRALLVAASWTNRVHAPKGDVAKLARRVARRKGKMHGTVAGAHKLVRIIYAILKQRRPYQPHAPEGPVSEQGLRAPRRRFAASNRVRRTALGFSSANLSGCRRAGTSTRMPQNRAGKVPGAILMRGKFLPGNTPE